MIEGMIVFHIGPNPEKAVKQFESWELIGIEQSPAAEDIHLIYLKKPHVKETDHEAVESD